jgi:16S rRNA (cytosine1402-N4)-methyltransferase
MVEQVLAAFSAAPPGMLVDATCGTAGHSLALLSRFPSARLLALDWDPRALDVARKRLRPFASRVLFRQASFGRLPELLEEVLEQGEKAAGVLVDPGLSSFSLEDPSRGLSYRFPESPLDMRYDPSLDTTAADGLSKWSAEELEKILRTYGDVRPARRLARGLVAWRRERPLHTVGDLVEGIRRSLGRTPTPRLLSQTFQAIRLALFGELDELERCLRGLHPHMAEGSPLVIICYQSLETRRIREVLRGLRDEQGKPFWVPLIRKSVVPSREEVKRNPRARSARLRAYRKASP